MLDPLPRQSLAQRAARWLTDAIAKGEWTDVLPGERALCHRLEVSRPVLREALQHLEDMGVISCEPNRARRILAPSHTAGRKKTKVLFLVGSEHLLEKNYNEPLLALTSETLAKHGIETDIRTQTSARPLLEKTTPSRDMLWVLVAVSEPTQRWFFERRIPAIVAGSTYPGIALSSLDTDHRAVARHAVGQFLRQGHRRIGFIIPDRPRAGDIDTEEGFLEGLRQSQHQDIVSTTIRCRADPEELSRKLKRLLLAKDAPTALFACRSHLALTALTFAHSIGKHVPSDLSLISRDFAPFLSFALPAIANYEHCQVTYARLLSRMIMEPPLTQVVRRLLPKFIAGQSIGPLSPV